MTRQQWEFFSNAISIAGTLVRSRVCEVQAQREDDPNGAAMYEKWERDVKAARRELAMIGVEASV